MSLCVLFGDVVIDQRCGLFAKKGRLLTCLVSAVWLCVLTLSYSDALLAQDKADSVSDFTTFDHIATGFPLEGQHDRVDCESCHVGAVFEELPTRCEFCHDNVFAMGQPPDHLPTRAACDTCHNEAGFNVAAAAVFDHSILVGQRCVDCHHPNSTASSKGPTHLATTDVCETCHSIVTWVPATAFDHDEAIGEPNPMQPEPMETTEAPENAPEAGAEN